MSSRWLVTGGAGFIGGHLTRRLAALGDAVTVLDIRVCRDAPAPGIRHVRADIRDLAALGKAMVGVDGVFHLAANADVRDCIANWASAHSTNCAGTMNVFSAAQAQGGVPVVYASSAAVYGDRSGEVCHESLPERPISPYGADKVSCEHHARAFWRIHGLPSAGLRLFNVYGNGQDPTSPYSSVLAQFCRNKRLDRPNQIFGDGEQTRDFIHVLDVVQAFVAAMKRLRNIPESWVSNVCTGHSVSLLEVSRIIDVQFGGNRKEPRFAPARLGDIKHSKGCTSQMLQLLGLRQPITLREGLTRSLDDPLLSREAI
ncbi:UDP-glucose 4-epimerase [Salinihabitans flavidus]|uniref:UDP-glucose 4-epimerase n=1 Tax=Salinihabitans flavidus TaxID=569882 RepID=A0A1H8W324_9RHOB|nr:NAD-dependent epimerase/dehydratase family protein [Salinihabitans flavidus]SEP22042.1 UDP-glucose 4-epimerase [Salinihabitans flavidus]